MAYRKIKGIPGLIYVADSTCVSRKHRCKDCFFCQWCSDSRCESCMNHKKANRRKTPGNNPRGA